MLSNNTAMLGGNITSIKVADLEEGARCYRVRLAVRDGRKSSKEEEAEFFDVFGYGCDGNDPWCSFGRGDNCFIRGEMRNVVDGFVSFDDATDMYIGNTFPKKDPDESSGVDEPKLPETVIVALEVSAFTQV